MLYFYTVTNKILTVDELKAMIVAGTINNTSSLESQNVFTFYNDYPDTFKKYTNLYNIAPLMVDGVIQYEYFEDEVVIVNPDKMIDPMFSEDITIPDTVTEIRKGYRYKWVLTAKNKDVIKPLLFAMLTEKKHTVEDAGATLPSGVKVQSASADRERLNQIISSFSVKTLFIPTDTASQTDLQKEFLSALTAMKFKINEGNWTSISQEDALIVFLAMGTRTLKCFNRENEITALIEAAYVADDAEAMLSAYFDNIETGWPA